MNIKCCLVSLVIALGTAGAFAVADLSKYTTADALWAHIEEMQRGPKERPSSQEEATAMIQRFLGEMDETVTAFIKQYPADARRWDAKLIQLNLGMARAQFAGKKPDRTATEATLKEIVAAPDASARTKAEVSFTLVQLHAEPLDDASTTGAVNAVATEIAAFQKQYPEDPRLDALRFLQAKIYEKIDPVKSQALLNDLTRSADPEVVEEAHGQLAVLEIKKKPVDLKFTAVDGAAIDLAKLRGKVVLLDFWATWCGPCMHEVPHLVTTYKKFHPKGFEIVGISLDKTKDRLAATTKDKEMTWPQYFDGKGWQNEISTKYAIRSIPAQWLLDKKGFVRSTEARENLEAQIEKLLAE